MLSLAVPLTCGSECYSARFQSTAHFSSPLGRLELQGLHVKELKAILHRRQPYTLIRLDLAFAGGSLGRNDLVTIVIMCPFVRSLKLTALRWKVSWVSTA